MKGNICWSVCQQTSSWWFQVSIIGPDMFARYFTVRVSWLIEDSQTAFPLIYHVSFVNNFSGLITEAHSLWTSFNSLIMYHQSVPFHFIGVFQQTQRSDKSFGPVILFFNQSVLLASSLLTSAKISSSNFNWSAHDLVLILKEAFSNAFGIFM